MNRFKILMGVIVIITIAWPISACGVGEAAAPVMAISTSIRSYGMGQTGVADDSDPANAFYNPALLASLNGAVLTVGYSNLTPI